MSGRAVPRIIRVLFCGSRDWTAEAPIAAVIHLLPPNAVVLHGAADGADTIAGRLARQRGLNVIPVRAAWHRFGNRAGHLRNIELRGRGVDAGFAFPLGLSSGTYDMISILESTGVPVAVYGDCTGRDGAAAFAQVAAARHAYLTQLDESRPA